MAPAKKMEDPRRKSWARRWLSIYATAFALLLTSVTGIFLVQSGGKLDSANTRLSLGLNLIASAIYSLVFAAFVTWILDRSQRESIDEVLRASLEQMAGSLSQRDRVYLPVAEFPALDTFGPAFNKALMESMERSKIYDFCGPSPRFVAARLRRIRSCPEQIRVSMIDPALDTAVLRRAADREKWASSAGKTVRELEKLLREELVLAIVGLFDFRTTCPVNIVYTSDLVVYRMELTDDAVFFSWYHGPTSSDKEMPEAAQFASDSLYYRVLRQEMTRRFEVLPHKVLFESRHDDSYLLSHLYARTGILYTESELVDLRTKYVEYTSGLTDFLRSMGY